MKEGLNADITKGAGLKIAVMQIKS